MARITFIGAGSTVFARNLLGDILGHEELAGSEIAALHGLFQRIGLTAGDAWVVASAVGIRKGAF